MARLNQGERGTRNGVRANILQTNYLTMSVKGAFLFLAASGIGMFWNQAIGSEKEFPIRSGPFNIPGIVEGQFVSPDNSIVVRFTIEDAYKVRLNVSTKDSGEVFNRLSKIDASRVTAEFVDLDTDGQQDILVQYEDEAGFSGLILLNRGTEFIDANPKDIPLVYRSDIYKPTGFLEQSIHGAYWLTLEHGRAVKDLVFGNLFSGSNGYLNVVLRFDSEKQKFFVLRKGEPLKIRGPEG